ncbi:MAG: ATP-binding protein [bacterium]
MISHRYLSTRSGSEQYEMLRIAGVRLIEEREDHIVHAIAAGFSDVDRETRGQMEKNRALTEALARAEEANAAKTAFLSSMSHEIRTPMNAIIGLGNIALRDPSISPETRDELEKIGSSARHLLALINDILDMSRIESGRMVLKSEEFSFQEMMGQIHTIINGQCEDKRLIYEQRMIGQTDDYFIGDVLRIRQIIINILGNAVKFTDSPGTVTFTVEQTDFTEDSRMLRFTMKDTGIGMDEAFLPRLFEPFSQEDATTTNRYGGSGLGMALTKNMVNLMGGRIFVESRKGAGTTFTVEIPIKRAQHVEALDTEETAETVISVEGLHVLIAEDVEMNAEILTDLLEIEEITSEWARNGQIAVDMFEKSPAGHFDAILMDMRMPVMDGVAATKAIRKLKRPDAASIPIIALTANAFEEDVRQCLKAGMNAHMSKPVDIEQLKKCLGRMLKESHGNR